MSLTSKGSDPVPISRRRTTGSPFHDPQNQQANASHEHTSTCDASVFHAQDAIVAPRDSFLLKGSLTRVSRVQTRRKTESRPPSRDELAEWNLEHGAVIRDISDSIGRMQEIDSSPASPFSSEVSSESESSFPLEHHFDWPMHHSNFKSISKRNTTAPHASLSRESNSHTLPKINMNKRPSLHSLSSLSISSHPHHSISRYSEATKQPLNVVEMPLYNAPVIQSSSSTSSSSGKISPSAYLIDDDPFANLSSPISTYSPSLPSATYTTDRRTSTSLQNSPTLLQASSPVKIAQSGVKPSVTTTSVHVISGRHRSSSSVSQQAQQHYIRPAFVSRPSLPSLSTLAHMNIRLPLKKKRSQIWTSHSDEPFLGSPSYESSIGDDLSEVNESEMVAQHDSNVGTFHGHNKTSTGSSNIGQSGRENVPSAVYTESPVEVIYGDTFNRTFSKYVDRRLENVKAATIEETVEDTSELPQLSVHDEYDLFLPEESTSSPASPKSLSSSQFSSRGHRFGNYMVETSSKTRIPHRMQTLSPYNIKEDKTKTFNQSDASINPDPYEVDSLTGWRPDNARMSGFEPGSSAGTVRPLSQHRRTPVESGEPQECTGSPPELAAEHKDVLRGSVVRSAAAHSGEYGRSAGNYSYNYSNSPNNYDRPDKQRDSDEGQQMPGGFNGGNQGSDDDDDDDIYRTARSAFSTSTSSDEEGSSRESGNEKIDRKVRKDGILNLSIPENRKRNGRKGVYRVPPTIERKESTEDDDVPLAQRIPGALTAQKSIRKKVKDEQVQRKREKMKSMPSSPTRDSSRPGTSRSVERGRQAGSIQQGSSTFRRVEVPRTPNPEAREIKEDRTDHPPARRGRARTIGEGSLGVAPEDLAKRLLEVQVNSPGVPFQPSRSLQDPKSASPMSTMYNSAVSPRYVTNTIPLHDGNTQERTVRPARSFHGSGRVEASITSEFPPQLASISAVYSKDAATKHQQESTSLGVLSKLPNAASNDPKPTDIFQEPSRKVSKSGRYSHETTRPVKSPTSQATDSKPQHIATPITQSVPPTLMSAPIIVSQMRIFLDNLQTFRVVEIETDANAGSVVDTVLSQGESLVDPSLRKSCMLFEICQDFGLERPIRDYELISEVSSSWNMDKMVNVFMIKKTSLAPLLHVQNMPGSAPKLSGYVEWESKRGKWNKRWLELREHGLWISKREGKGDFLCSLSTFDGYLVTRIHRSPKPFVFCVKSTDPISLFENKADYMHIFCCSEADGMRWLQSILLAKSYVLFQERHVLFSASKNASEGVRNTSNQPSRSGTYKSAGSQRTQPFVNVPNSLTANTPAAGGPFEPGSLLAKRTADNYS